MAQNGKFYFIKSQNLEIRCRLRPGKLIPKKTAANLSISLCMCVVCAGVCVCVGVGVSKCSVALRFMVYQLMSKKVCAIIIMPARLNSPPPPPFLFCLCPPRMRSKVALKNCMVCGLSDIEVTVPRMKWPRDKEINNLNFRRPVSSAHSVGAFATRKNVFFYLLPPSFTFLQWWRICSVLVVFLTLPSESERGREGRYTKPFRWQCWRFRSASKEGLSLLLKTTNRAGHS